ncbi:MAG: peptide chain release factor 2 [Chitinispirillaceae bacterium]
MPEIDMEKLGDFRKRIQNLRGYLEIDTKKEKLQALEAESTRGEFWDDPDTAQKVLKKVKGLKSTIEPWENAKTECEDTIDLIQMAQEEQDEATLNDLVPQIEKLEKEIQHLEFVRKLSGENDRQSAIFSIHSGAGGTESCDWCDMLYRMYVRWIENKGFSYTIIDILPGEEAGLKSVTLEVEGEYAYGHLKAESGVHRLVRISPFDSNARRHTSFASVFAYPVIEEVDDVEIEDKDLRIDTYRASGAGGQHVNKTDSAVRITHIPTGIVVQCQNERSQMKNRATAMRLLKSRVKQLYREQEEKERSDKLADKKKIEWGSQIRSYVLHPYNMVKDHRTNTETSNTQAVLDGNIDQFIENYLLQFQ